MVDSDASDDYVRFRELVSPYATSKMRHRSRESLSDDELITWYFSEEAFYERFQDAVERQSFLERLAATYTRTRERLYDALTLLKDIGEIDHTPDEFAEQWPEDFSP